MLSPAVTCPRINSTTVSPVSFQSHADSHRTASIHLCERRGSLGGVEFLRLGGAVREREFEVFGDQLLDVWSLDVFWVLELNDLEDVNAPKPSPMSGRHILVQSVHGIGATHLPVLLVHVVCAAAGIISDPDAEVLDLEGALLVDDVEGHEFGGGTLQLAQLGQEVPEAGFGDHGVGREDSHAVQFGGGVDVGWQAAAYDLVFLEATHLD